MKDVLVSIIIPSYNGSKYILETINSILSQTYKDFEIIVVDDKSEDNSLQVLSKFKDQIKVLEHAENKGISQTRNTGIKESKGELLAFIDDDDLWHEKKLEIFVRSFEESKDINFAFSDFKRFEWKSRDFFALSNSQLNPQIYRCLRKQVYKDVKTFVISKEDMFNLLVNRYPIYPSTMMMKREIFEMIGSWNENLKIGEDWDLSVRATRESDFIYIDESLTSIGRHDTNLSKYPLQFLENSIGIINNYLKSNFFTKEEKRLLKRSKASRHCGLGFNYINQNQYSKARRNYLSALRFRNTFFHALMRLPRTIIFRHNSETVNI